MNQAPDGGWVMVGLLLLALGILVVMLVTYTVAEIITWRRYRRLRQMLKGRDD